MTTPITLGLLRLRNKPRNPEYPAISLSALVSSYAWSRKVPSAELLATTRGALRDGGSRVLRSLRCQRMLVVNLHRRVRRIVAQMGEVKPGERGYN